jgi:hypothetical protein
MNTIEIYNPAQRRELQRILWRQSVLARGGASWLAGKAEVLKFKEKLLGDTLEPEFIADKTGVDLPGESPA